jgi:hypothetical protein
MLVLNNCRIINMVRIDKDVINNPVCISDYLIEVHSFRWSASISFYFYSIIFK